ncbi:MAG: hydroxymyristoyl-ACP dehydratase [Comamonas sp.]
MTDVWSSAPGLGATGIAARIPHAGSMCLLQGVREADAEQLQAVASSHRLPGNPLARNGRLGAACGVEYAAQAMALHGALTAQAEAGGAPDKARAGYLVNVRNLVLQVQRLDDIAADLLVQVQKFDDSGAFTVYDFSLAADESPARPLLSGRAYVMLQAPDSGVDHG